MAKRYLFANLIIDLRCSGLRAPKTPGNDAVGTAEPVLKSSDARPPDLKIYLIFKGVPSFVSGQIRRNLFISSGGLEATKAGNRVVGPLLILSSRSAIVDRHHRRKK